MYVVHEDMGFKSVDSVREIKEEVYNVCGVKHSPKTVKFWTISSHSPYSGRQASVASCRTVTIKRYLYNEGH